MSKLSKDFKNEINQDFREFDYVGKRVTIRILVVVLIVGLLATVGNVLYKEWKTDKDRDIFKNSVTYTESAASFLADSYKEYNEAETDAEKNAIMQYVIMRYPNLDTDSIDNMTLRQFYNKCLIGG